MQNSVNLYVRRGDDVVAAPERDLAVARGYDRWIDKGSVVSGRRVTILSAKKDYAVGEEVRVLHVVEVLVPGDPVFVMGPKRVLDEFLDGEPLGETSNDNGEVSFLPSVYDGRVSSGPGVDFNFDITSVRFDSAGSHEFRWRPGQWESNVLAVTVS